MNASYLIQINDKYVLKKSQVSAPMSKLLESGITPIGENVDFSKLVKDKNIYVTSDFDESSTLVNAINLFTDIRASLITVIGGN